MPLGDFTPRKNPTAIAAYRCAWVGLIPVLAIPFGVAAVVLGTLAARKYRLNPDVGGLGFAYASVFLGSLEFLTNVAGLACIAYALTPR